MSKFIEKYFKEEPEIIKRFISYVKDKKPKNLSEFIKEFENKFKTPQGQGALKSLDEEDYKFLWESKEADKAFGRDREITIKEEPIYREEPTKLRSFTSSYIKNGKNIKAYSRDNPRKFTKAQVLFIQVRKVEGIKPQQVQKEYNEYFKEDRSKSSISTKYYRL